MVTSSTANQEVTIVRGTGKAQIRSTFRYDGVYGSYATQAEVFDGVLAGPHSVLSDVMRGYESTVFAYGQTGTGKTHTMEGDLTNSSTMGVSKPEDVLNVDSDQDTDRHVYCVQQIIPRAAMQIFKDLDHKRFESSHVTASYLEIYNEHLTDLLANEDGSPASEKLQIVEDPKKGGKGVHCMGLSEHPVTSPDDVLRVLQEAQRRRQVGETKMNKASSRSHCLFTLTVHSKEKIEGGTSISRRGKLHLVDLAGSECAKSAGSESAAQERERKNINQSLLTLGRVVEALRQKQKNPNANVRVPYRDSKLSRLLKESLGGKCRTCIIATLSPSVLCCDETLQTLNYAQRAHGIKNKPVASSRMQMNTSSASAGSQGDPHLEERCNYVSSQLEEAQSALARAHDKNVELTTRAESAEDRGDGLAKKLDGTVATLQQVTGERDQLEANLKATQETLEATKSELNKTQQALATSQGELSDTRTELCSVRTAVSSFCETRGQKTIKLHAALLDAANAGKKSVTSLCRKLDDLHDVAEQENISMSGWISTMRSHVSQVQDSFAGLHETHVQSLHSAGQSIAKFMEEEKSLLFSVQEGLGSLLVNVEAQEEAEKTQIESISAAQTVVVEATGAQLQALAAQHDIAVEQSKKIADVKTLQNSLQKALVASVLAGVENLLTEEMDKLGVAVVEGMEPIQSANTTIELTTTDLTTKVSAMAQELDDVHDVAVQAAKIWGDSGRSTAASIREVTKTNRKCADTVTAAIASVDAAVVGSVNGATEIRKAVDTSSTQWNESLHDAANQLAVTKAKTINAHSATRDLAGEQQRRLHSFQVYNDEQAAEAIKCIGAHNMVQGMAEELEMHLTGSASDEVSIKVINTVEVPEVTKTSAAPINVSEADAGLTQCQDTDATSTSVITGLAVEKGLIPVEEAKDTPDTDGLAMPKEGPASAADDEQIAEESPHSSELTEQAVASIELTDADEEENVAGDEDDEADSYEMTMDVTSILTAPAPAAESTEDCASEDNTASVAAEESTVRRLRLTAAANEMKAGRAARTRRSTRGSTRGDKSLARKNDQENIDDSANPYVPAKTAKRASTAKRQSVQADQAETDEKPRRTTRTRRVLAAAN